MIYTTKVERPITATLWVRAENGDEWQATDEDLDRFKLLPRDAYVKARIELEKFLDCDFTKYKEDGSTPVLEAVNLVAYLIEAFATYDFANLDHVEYRDDALRLARLLGIDHAELPNDNDVPWDQGGRECNTCYRRKGLLMRDLIVICPEHPSAGTRSVVSPEDVPF